MELVTALKEGITVPNARVEVEVEEGDEGGTSILERPKKAICARAPRPTSSSTTTGSILSCLSHTTMRAMASLGDPPPFESLKEFFEYLETKYGGIRHDRMLHI